MSHNELAIAANLDEVYAYGAAVCERTAPGFIIERGVGTVAILDTLEEVTMRQLNTYVPFTNLGAKRLEPVEGMDMDLGLHVDSGYRGFAVHRVFEGPDMDVRLGFSKDQRAVGRLPDDEVAAIYHGRTGIGRHVVFGEGNVESPFSSRLLMPLTAHHFERPNQPARYERYTGVVTDRLLSEDELADERETFRLQLAAHLL